MRRQKPNWTTCHQMRFPVLGLCSWPKQTHWNPKTTQAVVKSILHKLTESPIPLLNTTPTQFTEYAKVDLVPRQSFQSYILSSVIKGDALHAIKENGNTKPATQPLTHSGALAARYASAIVSQSLW